MMRNARRQLYEILEGERADDPMGRVVNTGLVALILLSSVAVILESVSSLAETYGGWFQVIEVGSLTVFVLEYVFRLWVCVEQKAFQEPWSGRLRYLITPFALVDLMACLPALLYLWVPADTRIIRVFRVWRLLRLLKLTRYNQSFDELWEVLRNRKGELIVTLAGGILFLLVASTFMYLAEQESQPEVFSSIPATMWWGVATLTTVGYGDMFPVTVWGKLWGGIVAVVGIGLFALPAGIIGSGLVEWVGAKKSQETHCPHCQQVLSSSTKDRS